VELDEWALLTGNVTALVIVWSFVAMYASAGWRSSPVGRALMASSVALGVMSIGGICRRLATWTGDRAWADAADWLVAVGWWTIAAAMTWRLVQLARMRRGQSSHWWHS
jgi:hypothetical protein